LPPIYFDGKLLPFTDTFKYLGLACDKASNLNVAAYAALKLLTAGTFRVKKSLFRNTTLPTDYTPRFGSLKTHNPLLARMQVRSGLPPTYDRPKRWTIPYRNGC